MQRFGMNQLHLVATILFSLILGANAFSYKEAENWGKKYQKCNGKHQSPIFFKTPSTKGFPRINQTLQLTDFEKLPTKLTIKNTGHTVEIKADWSGEPPRCTGGPLHGNYVFEKATFHWNNTKRAEELFPLHWFHMEMHMFFYKKDLKSFEEAQTQKGGLAVFKMDLTAGTPNLLFENLEVNLRNVESINSSAVIPPFPVASIFDSGYIPFLFYEGSLDYPPCSESVTWITANNAFPITYNLLNGFRQIKLAEGDMSNIRPFQALNKRQVKMVFDSRNNRPALEAIPG